jgi:hypothetical protein
MRAISQEPASVTQYLATLKVRTNEQPSQREHVAPRRKIKRAVEAFTRFKGRKAKRYEVSALAFFLT